MNCWNVFTHLYERTQIIEINVIGCGHYRHHDIQYYAKFKGF
jgi:hypothetical protein